jgi:hypothetical protein
VEVVRYRRASAVTPGKHGPLDWRVTFNGTAPTHDEIVFVVGMLLLAEDRYDGRSRFGRGRYMPWYFLDRLLLARTPADVLGIAEDCATSKDVPVEVRAGAAANATDWRRDDA